MNSAIPYQTSEPELQFTCCHTRWKPESPPRYVARAEWLPSYAREVLTERSPPYFERDATSEKSPLSKPATGPLTGPVGRLGPGFRTTVRRTRFLRRELICTLRRSRLATQRGSRTRSLPRLAARRILPSRTRLR